MKFYGKRLGNKKGFTLIELLIVIAILAILALLGLPRLAQFREDAKISEIQATGQVIGRAAEAYLAAHESDATPPSITDADTQLGPYLNGKTRDQMGDYTVTGNSDGVTVTYTGTVDLPDDVVYDSETSTGT